MKRSLAVSALAAKYLLRENATHLLLFGSGPQARGHLDAMRSLRAITNVTIVAKTQPNAEVLGTYADIVVCAIGSNEPRWREVDGLLVGRSTAIVEGVVFSSSSMFSIRDLTRDPSREIDHNRPSFFKSSGMAWDYLAVAERVFRGRP